MLIKNSNKHLSAMLTILATVLLLPSLSACSDDKDEPQPVPVTIEPVGENSFVSFISTGSFDITVKMTGLEGKPDPAEFTFFPETQSNSNLVFNWDEESTDPAPAPELKPLSVSAVEQGEEPGEYILTLDYDLTGNMSAFWSGVRIGYGKAISVKTISFHYEGMAQKSVAMPVETVRKSETNEFSVDIREGLKSLGLESYDDYEDIFAYHGCNYLYVGLESDDTLSPDDKWKDYPGADPSIGTSYVEEGGSVITIPLLMVNGINALDAGKTYYLHYVIRLGDAQYGALHQPLRVEE